MTVNAKNLTEVREALSSIADPRVRCGGTKTAASAGANLCIADMAGVQQYEPSEYTFTALAGTKLADVRQMLAGTRTIHAIRPTTGERRRNPWWHGRNRTFGVRPLSLRWSPRFFAGRSNGDVRRPRCLRWWQGSQERRRIRHSEIDGRIDGNIRCDDGADLQGFPPTRKLLDVAAEFRFVCSCRRHS